jgi:hypothetical protein
MRRGRPRRDRFRTDHVGSLWTYFQAIRRAERNELSSGPLARASSKLSEEVGSRGVACGVTDSSAIASLGLLRFCPPERLGIPALDRAVFAFPPPARQANFLAATDAAERDYFAAAVRFLFGHAPHCT